MYHPMKKLSKQEQSDLFDALYFMKMAELKKVCEQLGLPVTGVKGERIDRIKHFITTGTILEEQKVPEVSKAPYYAKASKGRAKKDKEYPLKPNGLILFGAYKNDAQTRAFFKKLVGNHFHFTAFGIDWLKMRWMQGKPPTYQEFADMWQKETERRKNKKPEPKKEWALITFVQKYMQENPDASKERVLQEWDKLRKQKVAQAQAILKKL